MQAEWWHGWRGGMEVAVFLSARTPALRSRFITAASVGHNDEMAMASSSQRGSWRQAKGREGVTSAEEGGGGVDWGWKGRRVYE